MKINEIIIQQGSTLSEDPSTKMFLDGEYTKIPGKQWSDKKGRFPGTRIWQEIDRAANFDGIDKINGKHNAKLKFNDGTIFELSHDEAVEFRKLLQPLVSDQAGKNLRSNFARMTTLAGLDELITELRNIRDNQNASR